MKNYDIQQVQTSVLKKFMAPEEFRKFIDTYRANKGWSSYRFSNYRSPITPKEIELVRAFFTEGKSREIIAKELNISTGKLDGDVAMVIKKIVFQNRTKLGI